MDSLWFSPISQLTKKLEWVPITRKNADFRRVNDEYFLEGGVLAAKKGSKFIERALTNFPQYDENIADCWPCVGPQLLTATYIE